jgi:hypothetical protein
MLPPLHFRIEVKLETVHASERLVPAYLATQCHSTKDHSMDLNHCENLEPYMYVRFEVLMAVTTKSTIFWDMTLCSPVEV